MEIIVGTAGHIDHGKTALIKALTGVDADRLPEEKQRGITIDLGFAELDFDGVRFGFVDVPGHERFVKNMLAGATGIDVVLLVIAADEGIMPQTREHFEICRLLDIKSGVIALAKRDLASDDLLDYVKLEVAELAEGSFLDGAPVIETSSKDGGGIGDLKKALVKCANSVSRRQNEIVMRLPIDRKFSVKGFGTVVTGTLISGSINENEELELLPAGQDVRVRGIQSHGQKQKSAAPGQRTAVNLGGIDHAAIERGMMLSERGMLRPTQIVDAEVEMLAGANPLKSRRRVRFHIGTTEALGRTQVLNASGDVAGGEMEFVQLRLEKPVIAVPGDRFILRSYSPQLTIGGGRILNSLPVKHRRKNTKVTRDFLTRLVDAFDNKQTRLGILVEIAGESGMTFGEMQANTGWNTEILRNILASGLAESTIIVFGDRYFHRTAFGRLQAKIQTEIENFHRREPLAAGIHRETLRERTFPHLSAEVFKTVLARSAIGNKISISGDFIKTATFRLELSDGEIIIRDKMSRKFSDAKLDAPKIDDVFAELAGGGRTDTGRLRKILQTLVNEKKILRVTDEFCFDAEVIEGLVIKMRNFASTTSDRFIDVPTFKEIAGVSRKYAIPLLEYFDRQNITRRAGDKRIVL